MQNTIKKIIPFILAIAAIGFVVLGVVEVNKQNNYTKGEGVISSITTEPAVDPDGTDTTTVMVKYTVDGKDYESALGSYSADMKEGQTVEIKYNPADPSDIVKAGAGNAMIIFAVAAALAIGSVGTFVAKAKGKL